MQILNIGKNIMGKESKRRPTLISDEENTLRWAVMRGELKMSDEKLAKRIREIREKTGKP